ncbi:MAG: DHA2 family efflux MFS transporter permease subunit [Syntrophomonas sp.]
MLSEANATEKPVEAIVPWGAVLVLVIGAFMSILDSSIVNVALPRMMAVFGASTDEIEWVLTGYMLTTGVIIPLTGYLGKRFGHRRMYIIALAIFTVGSAFCGMAWSTTSMIIARIIQAIGGGMLIPISMAMIYLIVPEQKTGVVLGVWGIAAVMGPAIGPTLGGYLVDNFSWPWIFTINIPIGVVAIFLSMQVLKETKLEKALKPDLPGALFICVSAFALLLALSRGQQEGWTSQYIVTLLAVGIFSLLLFVFWELAADEPLIDMRLFRNPVMAAGLGAVAITNSLLFVVVFLVPIYSQNLLGYSPMDTGLMMLPMALATGFLMPVSGKVFDRYGAFGVGLAGLSILAGMTYYLHTLSLATSFGQVQLILALRALGLGLCMMPLANAPMLTVPEHLVGSASSALNLVRQVVASIAVAFTTYFVSQRQEYHLSIITEGINQSSPTSPFIIAQVQGYLTAQGLGGDTPLAVTLSVIKSMALKQAYMNGIDDIMVLMALLALAGFPLLFLLSKKRVDREKLRQGINTPANQAILGE